MQAKGSGLEGAWSACQASTWTEQVIGVRLQGALLMPGADDLDLSKGQANDGKPGRVL